MHANSIQSMRENIKYKIKPSPSNRNEKIEKTKLLSLSIPWNIKVRFVNLEAQLKISNINNNYKIKDT